MSIRRTLHILAIFSAFLTSAAAAEKTLDFYTIDVEGGKSVLVVGPAGDSMLLDAGWPAGGSRAASTDQIVAALKTAGVNQIDYLVISHFDIDHLGDIPALAGRIPIRHILDHGQIQFPTGSAASSPRFDSYAELRQKIGHSVLRPGDKVPLKGVDILVVTSAGQLLTEPLKGAGATNPLCASNSQKPSLERDVEDDQSIGLLFQFGNFRMLDLADLEAHLSHELVCPVNRIGSVDAFHVNVHGQFKGMAAELAGAIRPTVAIMGNGARKGGDPSTWPVLRATPGLQDIWQSHYSAQESKENINPPPDFIANLEQPSDEFAMIKLSVHSDGSYTVTNMRNGFTRKYQAGMAGGKKKH
jgi:beta-lactamase superfamily II metal-dependent hydrolase